MQGIELAERERALLAAFREGRRTALARLISIIEAGGPEAEALLHVLHPSLGRARRVGVTGPPGAGKSTLVAALAGAYRARGETVGVVAVDPTSPFTGGALLGDRIRMGQIATDPGVFIRSMATRGSLGGLALATKEVVDVLDAFGFDRVLIETVGVGQSELDIAAAADTTLVVLVPESGDSIQAMKAGLMEIADLFVVNKADRPGAERLARDVETMLHLRAGRSLRNVPGHHGVDLTGVWRRAEAEGREAGGSPGGEGGAGPRWEIPVLQTIAETGEGIPALVEALDRHHGWLEESRDLARRRRARLAERVRAAVERRLAQLVWAEHRGESMLAEALPALEAGEATPYEVAARIVRAAVTER